MMVNKNESQTKLHSPRRHLILPLMLGVLASGNKDQALASLEKAYAQHSNTLVTLKVEPRFDPLRGDPLYQDLLRRVRLAE
jgi:hypothetical protein